MGGLIGQLLPVLLGRVLNDEPGMDSPKTRYSKTMQGAHLSLAGALVLGAAAFGYDLEQGAAQEIAGAVAVILGLIRTAQGRQDLER